MFIYIVTNKINGKEYVGQTTANVDQRWLEHKSAARRGYNQCPLFYRALRKYGPSSFLIKAIAFPVGTTQIQLDEAERAIIATRGTRSPNGYNLRSGGYGGKLHPDTCAKLSAVKKGQKRSPEARAKISAGKRGKPNGTKGIPKSPEHRLKIAAKNKGHAVSTEVRLKISLALTGRKQPNRIVSESARARLSEKAKQQWVSGSLKQGDRQRNEQGQYTKRLTIQ